ncbi:MAG: serine/threonine-protein phosphatase [Deltaproteobacteria bacterium]|nr:serine/threonine-protein phosphatase [Deltaproteobacteria bacterium]
MGSASFEPHLLSLPFALAPAAMLIVVTYTAVMRGASLVRGFLLTHILSLLPYGTAVMLSPSITDRDVAEQLFRVAAAFIPMAAAAGTAFQITLVRRYRTYRPWIWFGLANAAVWVAISSTTDAAVSGVQRLGGFWYPIAGPWAWAALLHTILLSSPGFLVLAHLARTSAPSDERRQWRAALLANIVTYAGLIDVAIAYGVDMFPLGWLLSGVGSLLVVRALVVEDLLRVRAVDTTVPLLVLHFAAAVLLGWVALAQLGTHLRWWGAVAILGMSFAGVRASVAVVALVNRGARSNEGPLERLLAELVGRARTLVVEADIAHLAIDIVNLGIGVRPEILLASEEDYGWSSVKAGGVGAERIDDEAAPDPLLGGWLVEHADSGPLWADDLEPVPADLRELVAQLFARHDARALVAVRSGDELLGLVAIPRATRRLRPRSVEFLARTAERLAEALVHARMARRAAERAALAREVELAATVQGELLPGKGPHVHGAVTVVGSWRPATRCAGDFWGVYPLTGARVLVVIGDVTGHGVASAMVTAAAIGACDVCVRRGGARFDLAQLVAALDAAVRRVGGGELAMTCFAAILDPAASEIRFVSCGHTSPYLVRAGATEKVKIELQALVGRGNPLGTSAPAAARIQHKPLQAGDLVVCYTDGVIEAQDPGGTPFGDRRLQHLLKKLDGARLAPAHVHDLVLAGIATHRSGRPLADDETIVVARLADAARGAEGPPP